MFRSRNMEDSLTLQYWEGWMKKNQNILYTKQVSRFIKSSFAFQPLQQILPSTTRSMTATPSCWRVRSSHWTWSWSTRPCMWLMGLRFLTFPLLSSGTMLCISRWGLLTKLRVGLQWNLIISGYWKHFEGEEKIDVKQKFRVKKAGTLNLPDS